MTLIAFRFGYVGLTGLGLLEVDLDPVSAEEESGVVFPLERSRQPGLPLFHGEIDRAVPIAPPDWKQCGRGL